ncbi:MAG: hypothetical protein B6D77_04750 [gamma proteobacterium symbiont of Ctena orbiculata]|nr:MAG: hypothetical protein B6D77_04750 [gamma proteobacterium symbiont of Ctena orbiculata]PVV19836.1 MAG: hypothetical protein B6D78_12315 [gamma proteobacterium symbiont of Ctena orbiculata]PVV26557.1 MAG: hypothetical protein B6D79_05890 [gamma proteobacterium symbiont of Ctena orbiculata]
MRIDALLWLISLACLVGLGDVLAREPYADFKFRSTSQTGFVFQQESYRWRPLNDEDDQLHVDSPAESFNEQRQYRQSLYPSSVVDYAETPPGLPRGVYRPVEERHAITPHKDGYRFRTLTPKEQLRIKRRNEEYTQYQRPPGNESRMFLSTDSYGLTEPRRQKTYKFRPDKRLDKKQGGGNWGPRDLFPYNPAFTDAYQTPMFRPE